MESSPSILTAPRWMSNNEAWRQEYRLDPYLAGASTETLEQRSRDLNDNMMWVNERGQLTVRSKTPQDQRWWALWTHVLEEIGRRGRPWYEHDLMNSDRIHSMITAPEAPPGRQILRGASLPSAPYLARLGKKAHVLDAYAKGRFRITPASLYADPSLNAAISDDELSIAAVRRVEAQGLGAVRDSTSTNPIAEVIRTAKLNGDYYVLCMASRYDIRLLSDFEADALLIIRKPIVFARRLEAAVRKIKPRLKSWFGPVEYYDPYRLNLDANRIPMLKHFKHAYQSEARFAWLGGGEPMNFEPFFVDIGPLRDISNLYCLGRAG